MHRFFYDFSGPASDDGNITLDSEEANHLFRILRALPGDRVGLLDGKGTVATAEVLAGRRLRLLERTQVPPPDFRIHLYTAVPRRQKMDLLLRQTAELGVSRIIPVRCQRSVALPSGEGVSRRWDGILMEACKQSGNPRIPETEEMTAFPAALEDAAKRCSVLFYGSPDLAPEKHFVRTGDLAVFIGPEGGFTPEEELLLKNASAHPLRIGPWTLRIETAASAALAVLHAACDGLF